MLNKYGIAGTFHLNSNKLETDLYLNKAEIKQLFVRHEVSIHSANHPNLSILSKIDIVYEVVEGRKELERLIGYSVRRMAYSFGNNNEFVIDAIKGSGREYARIVDDTYTYKIPDDFLNWHPTIHQFVKAYFISDKPVYNKKEFAKYINFLNCKKTKTWNSL